MDPKETEEEEEDGEEALFVENFSSSDDEGEGVMELSDRKQAARLGRVPSPPLLLAFSFSSGRAPEDSSASPASGAGVSQEEEDGGGGGGGGGGQGAARRGVDDPGRRGASRGLKHSSQPELLEQP